jgi:4-hydroxyphenylpyruvate dioxygenase
MTTGNAEFTAEHKSPLPFRGIDYVEFYVGNATQATHFYSTAFGFKPIAYSGPETGVRDRMSYALEQGDIRFVMTSPLSASGEIAEHIHRHCDGVKDVALRVDDAAKVFEEAVRRGARPVMEPTGYADDDGQVVKATVAAFGDTVHTFVQRNDYRGKFLPQYQTDSQTTTTTTSTGLVSIDHLAIAVESGTIERWVEFYNDVLGFRQSRVEDIATEYSAMNSKVVESDACRLVFVLVEPTPGRRKSPIDEYLTYYDGAGVHHVAMLSDDIVSAVARHLLRRTRSAHRRPSGQHRRAEGVARPRRPRRLGLSAANLQQARAESADHLF